MKQNNEEITRKDYLPLNAEELREVAKEAYKDMKQKDQTNKEINTFIKKTRKLIKAKQQLAEFEEPIMMLIRRNGEVEITEEAKGDTYKFEHSNGKEAEIHLRPSMLLRFPYAGQTFRGYICYEDETMPLPANPLMETETMGIVADKLMHDMKKWKANEEAAIGKKWKAILVGIAIVIAAIIGIPILGGFLGVDVAKYLPWIKPAANATIQAAQNVTTAVKNMTPTILT